MALRRPRKTMKMRPPFHRRSGAGRSPGAGAWFPTQGRTEGIGPLQFVFISMTVERSEIRTFRCDQSSDSEMAT